MGKLPSMPGKAQIRRTEQVQFSGLRHYENCSDGEIYDMRNMVCDKYPILSTRKERGRIVPPNTGAEQIYADNGVILTICDHTLYYNGIPLLYDVAGGENSRFVRFGNRVVLMPDKLLLNLTYRVRGFAGKDQMPQEPSEGDCYAVWNDWGECKLMVWQNGAWADGGYFGEKIENTTGFAIPAYFEKGTINGKEAKANTIRFVGLSFTENTGPAAWKEGDGVTIEGCSRMPKNNKLAIIREIDQDSDGNLIFRFSENCFAMEEEEDGTAVESFLEDGITVKRTMPDMDVLFEHGNRLWGAKGKEIYASKIGDPRNWNSFDSLSSDSWYLATQGKGEFTAGISYGGYPRFFKEGGMVTVYGSVPSAFQTMEQALLGVKKGEEKSLTHCNNLLFWNSPKGMVIYNGSSAALQEQVFGDWKLQEVRGGGDLRYAYFSADIGIHPLSDTEREYGIFRFDTERQLWSKEDDVPIKSLSFDRGILYGLLSSGEIVVLNGEDPGYGEPGEGPFFSYVEFGDFTAGTMSRKGMSRICLRLEVAEEAEVEIFIQYDSSGEWIGLRKVESIRKGTVPIPIIPRRCDHYRLRLEGYGQWKLHGIEKERYFGSDQF